MTRGYLLVDGNNIGMAAASGKRLVAGEQETQGIFGFLRTLRALAMRFPQLKPVILWDGYSWRYQTFPEYKAKRDKKPESKAELALAAIRASWRAQKPLLSEGLRYLQVGQLHALNMEADDLAAMCVDRWEKSGARTLMVTSDRDWLQLIGPLTSVLNPRSGAHITLKTFSEKIGYQKKEEWIGVPSPRAFLDVKALTGDGSDEIPGVGGIGEKGAIDLVVRFGSVQEFRNRVILEKLDLHQKLLAFAESDEKWEIFYRNIKLMDLRTKEAPAPIGLTSTPGTFDPAAFEAFCLRYEFQSLVTDMSGFLEPFVTHAQKVKAAA